MVLHFCKKILKLPYGPLAKIGSQKEPNRETPKIIGKR